MGKRPYAPAARLVRPRCARGPFSAVFGPIEPSVGVGGVVNGVDISQTLDLEDLVGEILEVFGATLY